MARLRWLPWEYGVRNLLRRPMRSLLTLGALSTVVLLVFVVVGFIRGLESSLGASGDPAVVLVYSLGAGENVENSSIPAPTPGLLAASLSGIQRQIGVDQVSGELYMALRVATEDRGEARLGLVRGVTSTTPLVRQTVRIVEGRWPAQDEVLAGRLAYAKLGCPTGTLAVGNSISIEGRRLRISGRFTAGGSAFESELWCPLADLSRCVKRQDLSLVALRLAPGKLPTEVDLFCKERVDLELQAVAETDYYASLGRHYRPVRLTAWVVVGLIAGAGLFAGLNTMHGAVVGRVRELATLQAIGFRRLAILVSLVQEGALLGAAGSLVGGLLGSLLVGGIAVRFTMGAFDLRVDAPAVLTGFAVGLLLGVLGAVPPAMRAMRLPVAESLKAI